MVYITSIHQPLDGINYTHEDHHEHNWDHQHGVYPMVLDVSQCAQLPKLQRKISYFDFEFARLSLHGIR